MFFKKFQPSRTLACITLILFLLLIFQTSISQGVNQENKEVNEVFNEGMELYRQGEYGKAVIKFSQVTVLAKDQIRITESYLYLSLCYFALGDLETAKEQIKRVLERDLTKEVSSIFYPPEYVEMFDQIKEEEKSRLERLRIEREVEEKAKEEVREKKRKPILKHTPPKEEKPKKKGKSFIFVIAGLAVGGVVAALLLGKKGNGGGGTTPSGPTTGSIQVNSSPTGAQVYLDESYTGKTTNTTLTNVSPGSHTIELVKEGYKEYARSISVTAGQTATVNANLTKHTITVTRPKGNTIWAQGEEVVIKWSTDNSSNYQVNTGLNTQGNPIISQRNELPNLFQMKRFKPNGLPRDVKKQGGKFEEISTLEGEGKISSKFPRSHGSLVKSSSKKENTDELQKSSRNMLRGRLNSLGRLNRAIPRIASQQVFKTENNMKILTLTNVKIRLYKGSSIVKTIASSTENDGSHKWTVPTSLTNGSNYKVRIACVGKPELYDESKNFRIEKKSITVKEPKTNTIWTKGKEVKIKWTTKGQITEVKIRLYKGSSIVKTIASSTENDGSHEWTVPTSLTNGSNYKVRIASVGKPDIYDESKNFSVKGGFNSQFNGSAAGWAKHTGTWRIENNSFYVGLGSLSKWSSTSYNAQFRNFSYEAKLRRYGSDTSSNNIMIRGDPSSLRSDKMWNNVYIFQYLRDGRYSVFKEVGGSATAMQSWTSSSAINKGSAWNILRVIANGSRLKFYINGRLVWSGNDSTFSSGRVGISMYSPSSTGQKLQVDWAKLTVGDFSSFLSDTVSEEQRALNKTANEYRIGSIRGIELKH